MNFSIEGSFLKYDLTIWYYMIYLSFMKEKGLVFTKEQFSVDIDFKVGTIFNSDPIISCIGLGDYECRFIKKFVFSVVTDFRVNISKFAVGYRWYFDYIDENRYMSELADLINYKVPLKNRFKFKK